MSNGKQFTVKHYVFLLIWWLSMGWALANKTVWLGIVFLLGFFFVTTFKTMGKLIIFMAAIFLATMIFPPLAAVVAVLSVIFLLLRIKFLVQNWRALTVGLYAYFVYLLVVASNGFFFKLVVVKIAMVLASLYQDHPVVEYGSTAALIAAYLFPLALTIIFHRLLTWLYRHGYDTNRAFHVMGLTPLILIAVILPFLKIDIDGHEFFHGSFTDSTGSVDIDASIDTSSLPTDFTNALDAANIDIHSLFDVNTATFSPAVEATVAFAAARGFFNVAQTYAKDFTLRKADGSAETITYVDETHAVIKDTSGQELGTFTFDENHSREIVRLTNGITYALDRVGNILDTNGKFLGKLKDDSRGGKILTDDKGKVIREFRADGSIFDGNGHATGIAV